MVWDWSSGFVSNSYLLAKSDSLD